MNNVLEWFKQRNGLEKAALIGAGLILIIGLLSLAGGGQEATKSKTDNASIDGAEETSPKNREPSATESSLTPGQENAVQTAQDYLDYSAFSERGLTRQLLYEGYSKADVRFAIDYLDVDWYQQAVQSARDYLDYTSFSKQGLIDQLSSSAGEGFTLEQAQYGANKAYAGG